MFLVDEAMCLLRIIGFSKIWWKLEVTLIFMSGLKENSYLVLNVLWNSLFLTKGINYNDKHYGKWKSSMYLKLDSPTL